MPLLKNAKKKLRQDKVRAAQNRKKKAAFKEHLKAAKTKKTKAAVSQAYSSIDKAAKQNIIHKNKAARLKSSLAKAIAAPTKSA
jgi:small subunit ribosomal protein S20